MDRPFGKPPKVCKKIVMHPCFYLLKHLATFKSRKCSIFYCLPDATYWHKKWLCIAVLLCTSYYIYNFRSSPHFLVKESILFRLLLHAYCKTSINSGQDYLSTNPITTLVDDSDYWKNTKDRKRYLQRVLNHPPVALSRYIKRFNY